MEGVVSSFRIMSGVPMARFRVVMEHEDLRAFQFPYFLKADVSGHKSEMGAVVHEPMQAAVESLHLR